jgi:hypothetical protein
MSMVKMKTKSCLLIKDKHLRQWHVYGYENWFHTNIISQKAVDVNVNSNVKFTSFSSTIYLFTNNEICNIRILFYFFLVFYTCLKNNLGHDTAYLKDEFRPKMSIITCLSLKQLYQLSTWIFQKQFIFHVDCFSRQISPKDYIV